MPPVAPRRASVLSQGPESLQRRMLLTAVVSIVLIVTLSGFAIYEINARHIIRSAEREAADLGAAIVALQQHRLLKRQVDGSSLLLIAPSSYKSLDEHLRTFLPPFDIVKIKIYDPEGKVLYSTEQEVVGEFDSDNDRLLESLQGSNDSHLKTKDEIVDLAMEKKFNIDVVETYVPIFSSNGKVVGSFEIYTDVTPEKKEIFHTVSISILVITGILLLVFSLAFFILRIGLISLRDAQSLLQKLASTDALTGVFNHREIMARAHKELARSKRSNDEGENSPLGLIMLDVDHFKKVNDSYGHPIGDEVLKELVRRCEPCLRTYDILGRYGGEEFLVLLPETSLSGVRSTARRILTTVGGNLFRVAGRDLQITVSLGIAETHAEETSIELALKRADDGLYIAKREGRNRIGCVTPQPDKGHDEEK